MLYKGCLVNGRGERQAWRNVVMLCAPAVGLGFTSLLLCVNTHSHSRHTYAGGKHTKYLAISPQVLCPLKVNRKYECPQPHLESECIKLTESSIGYFTVGVQIWTAWWGKKNTAQRCYPLAHQWRFSFCDSSKLAEAMWLFSYTTC